MKEARPDMSEVQAILKYILDHDRKLNGLNAHISDLVGDIEDIPGELLTYPGSISSMRILVVGLAAAAAIGRAIQSLKTPLDRKALIVLVLDRMIFHAGEAGEGFSISVNYRKDLF